MILKTIFVTIFVNLKKNYLIKSFSRKLSINLINKKTIKK